MVKDEIEIMIKLSRRGIASRIVDEFTSRSHENNNKSLVIKQSLRNKNQQLYPLDHYNLVYP
jgi:hypothetical protein